MPTELSKQLDDLLSSYSGPEPDRVRTAIAKLAKDDIQRMKHYLASALVDYRDVLWWSDIEDIEDSKRRTLQGMTVSERLCELNLLSQWDACLEKGDRTGAISILTKCQLSQSDIERIVDLEFKYDR